MIPSSCRTGASADRGREGAEPARAEGLASTTAGNGQGLSDRSVIKANLRYAGRNGWALTSKRPVHKSLFFGKNSFPNG
jgi:hypothetical protein